MIEDNLTPHDAAHRQTTLSRDAVPTTFDVVARRYDLQVALNPGYHANLRRAADALLDRLDRPDRPDRVERLVDLGCGSGASTKALASRAFRRRLTTTVVGVDGSAGMLEAARAKKWPTWVRFEQSRAEHLDVGSVDGILAAYLVRNVEDRATLLARLFDTLTPGGALAVHDYAVRGRPVAAALWTIICWTVVIPLGWATTGHSTLYRYLWRSAFDLSPEGLVQAMEQAGFTDVQVTPARNWARGSLHTVTGTRP